MKSRKTKPRARFWPAGVILSLQAVTLLLTITPALGTGTRFGLMMLGPLVCFLSFLIWLLFGSRLPRRESWLYFLALSVFAGLAAWAAHPMARIMVWIYAVPLAMAVLVVILFVFKTQSGQARRRAALMGLVLVFAGPTLLRLEGFTGGYLPQLAWRWSATAEQQISAAKTRNISSETWLAGEAIWPGFRGADRNGRVTAFIQPLNWQINPPQEAWRITMGPAWSSFAQAGQHLFTQEQLGDNEVISCYHAETGQLIWRYGIPSRFNEVVSGPGPRATPAVADGKVFAFGAKGVLSALDTRRGTLLWQRNLMAEANAPLPVWGFASSPLVVGPAVIIYAGGSDDQGILAFDCATGEPLWQFPSQGMNFSSAQHINVDGQALVLFADSSGLLALHPDDGTLAWRFKPSAYAGAPIVQSQQIGPNDLVVPLGDGLGLARLKVSNSSVGWQIEEQWSSNRLKPSFNGFVYHDGHLFGFDRNIFTCVDAATGERKWKRGRYGFGQVLILIPVGQLIIAAENGELILLDADPATHRELGRIAVLKGKTWNHPILAEGRIVVRNGKEAVSLVY